MTEQEFDKIRAGIKSAYPAHNVMPDVFSIRLWYRMLGDLDYKLCETAVLELAATLKFPPSIAEIREKCAEYTTIEADDSGEAWGLVQQAIRNYGYYRAEEALASLPETVRQAVNRIGFREICEDDNIAATRAHFMQIHKAIADRAKKNAAVPAMILENKRIYQSQIPQKEQVRIESQSTALLEDAERATPEYIDKLMREHGFRRP